MADPGCRDLKSTFIGIGDAGEQARLKVLPHFNDLMRQSREYRPAQKILGAIDSQPVFTTVSGKSFLQPPCSCLQDADLVYLCGSQMDNDFQSAREAILKNMDMSAYLFTFPVGSSHGFQPITDQECVICVQGTNPLDDIAFFVKDFMAWNIFPKTPACDWADIKTCLGGQEKSLAIYCAQSHDFEKGFTEFLGQQREELRHSDGILLLVSFSRKEGISWSELTVPLGILQSYVGIDKSILYLENCDMENNEIIRAVILF